MTTFLLQQAGLADAADLCRRDAGQAAAIAASRAAARPAGAEAAVRLARARHPADRRLDDLPAAEEVDDVYYLQRLCASRGTALPRLPHLRLHGRAVAVMSRRGARLDHQCQAGRRAGAARRARPASWRSWQSRAAAAVGADFAGVDIVRGRRWRSLLVLEVNSMPAWSGLQSVAAVNIADALARAHPGGAGIGDAIALAGQARDGGARRRSRDRLCRGLPARDRGAEARQRPCLRRRPPHGGGAVPGQRQRLGRSARPSRVCRSG